MWFVFQDTLRRSDGHPRESLNVLSPGIIASCRSHVGGQFASRCAIEPETYGHEARLPFQLIVRGFAFKCIDSLGDIVPLLCPGPIVGPVVTVGPPRPRWLHGSVADRGGPGNSVVPSGRVLWRGRARRPLQVPRFLS